MLTNENAVHPIHYPCLYNKFEFDEEVAFIFNNMATRSIPLYQYAHELHACIAQTHTDNLFQVLGRKQATILDVGASVGGFLHAICNQFQIDYRTGTDKIHYIGTDISQPMVKEFHRNYPWAEAICCAADTPLGRDEGIDVVCLMYVLQFIPMSQRDKVLTTLYNSMRDNAIIFLGQKEKLDNAIAPAFNWEYVRWRMRNGYTMNEIAAKTRALESVMWPETIGDTIHRLERVGFRMIRETSRWLQFSTLMARK